MEETKEFMDRILRGYESEKPSYALAVARKEDGEVIGSCGFAPLQDMEGMQIYYTFFPEYWRKGYATEASWMLLEYMFSELRIEKAFAFASLEKPASSGVARRLGMKYKGMMELENKIGELFGIEREEFLTGCLPEKNK